MTTLITSQLKDFLIQEEAEKQESKKMKDSFWPSESEDMLFNIYHKFKGTAPTNPIEPEKLLMFSAAKMMEVALVRKLQGMGIVQNMKTEDQQHFLIEREGIMVSGYFDAVHIDGRPIEIKTFYGDYQLNELRRGTPKTSYLKQLAMYMDALNQDEGILIYLERGTGEIFEFILNRIPNTLKFKCMGIEFDLLETYQKWSQLYFENVEKNIEPSPFECGKYKADIDSIDWSKISKSDISAARMGAKVIGENREEHWKILYSPYKNLIIERQGQKLGYNEEELAKIKLATKGYSTK